MARITVEDCLKVVDNRFDLVLIASRRARQLARSSADPLVSADNDKPTVIALREIAAGYLNFQERNPAEVEHAEDTAHQ